ncbi:MAG: YaiI/YqxD family protein [Planctomycetota bacterium]
MLKLGQFLNSSLEENKPLLNVYVDGDGCPVKDEVYRVAERYGLKVYVVANTILRVHRPFIQAVVVKEGLNGADDWIVEKVEPDDIVITADIPLADRCLQKKARVLGTTGKPFTDRMIGGRNGDARGTDAGTPQQRHDHGQAGTFKPADRSRFLSALDEMIHAIKRDQRKKTPSRTIPPILLAEHFGKTK